MMPPLLIRQSDECKGQHKPFLGFFVFLNRSLNFLQYIYDLISFLKIQQFFHKLRLFQSPKNLKQKSFTHSNTIKSQQITHLKKPRCRRACFPRQLRRIGRINKLVDSGTIHKCITKVRKSLGGWDFRRVLNVHFSSGNLKKGDL